MIAALASSGCDGGGPSGGERDASTTLSPPPFLGDSRAIDTGLLSVALTVGDDTVPVTESGGVWRATFTLPEGSEQTFPIEVIWSYAVSGREAPIPIARANRNVSLDDSRNLLISGTEYLTAGFDEDRDGRDNFTEIDENTDPLQLDANGAPIAPGPAQDDCRETLLNGERTVDFEAEQGLFRLGPEASDETRAIELGADRLLYRATLFLETSGTLTIEHLSGLPINTNALIYDRRRGALDTDVSTTNVQLWANFPGSPLDGVPARISERIAQPGLYCYALFDEVGADFSEGTALTDIVLRVRFEPGAS